MNNVAIYGLYGETGDVRYVGRTVRLKKRFAEHCREKIWPVGIKVLEWASQANWADTEKKWIAYFGLSVLENCNSGGEREYFCTQETRRKISLANTGRRHTPEAKLKISLGSQGRVLSAESKEKVRLALTGQKRSIEARQRMSVASKGQKAWNKGLTLPQVLKDQISQSTSIAITKWWADNRDSIIEKRRLTKANKEN